MTTHILPPSFPSQTFLNSLSNRYGGRTILTKELNKLSQKPDNPRTLRVIHNMAIDTLNAGNNEAAAELFAFIIISKERVLGLDHDETIASMYYLGYTQMQLSLYEKANSIWREIISRSKEKRKPSSLGARTNLGYGLNQRKQYVEAERVFGELLPDIKAGFAKDNPRYLECQRGIMEAVGGQGRHAEANDLCEKGLAIVGKMGGDHKTEEIAVMLEV